MITTKEQLAEFLKSCHQVISGIPVEKIELDPGILLQKQENIPDAGVIEPKLLAHHVLLPSEWLHIYFSNEGRVEGNILVPDNLQELDICDVYIVDDLRPFGNEVFCNFPTDTEAKQKHLNSKQKFLLRISRFLEKMD
jgi:hypothetical protein